MARPTLLREYQSLEVFKLESRGPGVYLQDMLTEGNSVLSSVFVLSADVGATVTVEYFDTTTGTNFGEALLLTEFHPPIGTALTTDKRLVTKIHNKPFCKATVAGGNVFFGVYATVVGTFPIDLGSTLVLDEQIFLALVNKGMPAAAVNDTDGKFHFLRVNSAGELITTASITGTITVNSSTTPAISNTSILVAGTEYSAALPASTKSFDIKSRSGAPFRLAFTSGNTSTIYSYLSSYSFQNLSASATITAYFQSNYAGDTIELISWS